MKRVIVQKRNIWKIISLIVIGIFCIIVAGGILKFYHIKSSFAETTPEQAELARSLVNQDLLSRGISDYDVQIAPKIRMDKREGKRTLIHVSTSNSTTQETYLIDLDKEKIILHSTTTFYEGMPEKMGRMPGRGWFHGPP